MLPLDYGIYALLLVLLFYFWSEKKIVFSIGMILIAIAYYLFENTTLQLYMLLAMPFLWLYNGKKGKSLKYWFYAFYPLHMLLIALSNFVLNFN